MCFLGPVVGGGIFFGVGIVMCLIAFVLDAIERRRRLD
jgi:hypothetical protein